MSDTKTLIMCRTCLSLSEKTDMLSIHTVAQLIMSYASVTITENDGLPSEICSKCHLQAKQAYEFKTLCEYADKKLHDSYVPVTRTKHELERDVCSNNSGTLASSLNENDKKYMFTDINPIKENKSVKKDVLDKCSTKSEEINNKCRNEKKKVCHTCRFCNMKFTLRTRLYNHEQKHEKGIRCIDCGKDFTTVKQLASHMGIHNRKGIHLCSTCGKQFTLPENLIRHQRIHSGTRPYQCKLCNKSFVQSNELKSHMVTHSSEKAHLCNVCGNKYARQMSLRIHMRRLHSVTSSLRPFKCNLCDRTFKDKRDLSQHNTIHKGERQHVCKVCNKAFNRSSNLKVHERIHTGNRPYICHICQRSFIQKHVLNTHLKTHPAKPQEPHEFKLIIKAEK